MPFKTSLKQLFRAPVKLIVYFLIAALAAALLCVGLNLEANAQRNVAAAEACFTTVAIPEVWGNMNAAGTLQQGFTQEDYAPYLDDPLSLPPEMIFRGYVPALIPETEYDLTSIREASGVEGIDVRGRFGARVNGGNNLLYGLDPNCYPCAEDVIVFAVNAPETLTVPTVAGRLGVIEGTVIPLTVEFSANPLFRYGDTLALINQIDADMLLDEAGMPQAFALGTEAGDGSFYLEPGKRYIATITDLSTPVKMNSDGTVASVEAVSQAYLYTDLYHNPHYYPYEASTQRQNSTLIYTRNVLGSLPIAPYEEGFLETEAGAFYREVIEAVQINARSLSAVATNDLACMRAFHSGKVYISSGRVFTQDEYADGAKVCIVSAVMAELNGWQLGDALSLSFYECGAERYNDDPAPPNQALEWPYSSYTQDAQGFFDEGEYTIVGLFDGKVEKGQWKEYGSGNDKLHAVNVLLPANSVSNAPAPVISKYSASIRIKNDEATDFMAEMAASGLMDSRENEYGSYELRLTVYDQGYSLVGPGLRQLSRVSRLTLTLALAAAGLAVAVLAVVHALRGRREVAAMRSLGTKHAQVMVISLAGVALVCLLGACVGAYAGHAISCDVTARVVESAKEDAADTTFTAMMGEGEAKEFEFLLESDPALALVSGGAVAFAFLLCAGLLLAPEFRNSPMLLLGAKE